MALEYTLEIERHRNCRNLEKLLCRIPEFEQGPEGVVASDMQVHIGPPHNLEVEMVAEEFGFKPTVSVIFRLDKGAEPLAVRKAFLSGCMALLDGNLGDMVFLFNGESVIFHVCSGEILLNPIDGFWSDEVLAVMEKPYRYKVIDNVS